jgi:hypothetical protein
MDLKLPGSITVVAPGAGCCPGGRAGPGFAGRARTPVLAPRLPRPADALRRIGQLEAQAADDRIGLGEAKVSRCPSA